MQMHRPGCDFEATPGGNKIKHPILCLEFWNHTTTDTVPFPVKGKGKGKGGVQVH